MKCVSSVTMIKTVFRYINRCFCIYANLGKLTFIKLIFRQINILNDETGVWKSQHTSVFGMPPGAKLEAHFTRQSMGAASLLPCRSAVTPRVRLPFCDLLMRVSPLSQMSQPFTETRLYRTTERERERAQKSTIQNNEIVPKHRHEPAGEKLSSNIYSNSQQYC